MRHLLPFLITFAIAYPLSLIGLDIHHDGVILKPALDVWSGQTLFLDSFSQYGPLTTWIQVLFMKVLGPSLFSIRVATAFFYSLSAVALTALWRLFLPESWVWISFAIWIGLAPYISESAMLPWPSVFALFFQIVAALCLIKSFDKNPRLAIISGASAAAVFWCRQPVGMVTIAGFFGVTFLHLIANRKTRKGLEVFGGFSLGLGLVFAAVLAHLFQAGSLHFWIEQNILWPAAWAKGTGGATFERLFFYLVRIRNESLVIFLVLLVAKALTVTFEKQFEAHPRIQWALALLFGAGIFFRFPLSVYQAGALTLIPLAGLFIAGPMLIKKPSWMGLTALVLVISSWAQFYPVNDSWHVYWAMSPAIGIFIYWMSDLLKNRVWSQAFFGCWLLSLALTQLPGTYRKLTSPYATVADPVLNGIRLPAKRAETLRVLVDRVRALSELHGNRPIVLEGVDPFYACLTRDLSNIHRMPMIWRAGSFPQTHFDLEGIRFIEARSPWIISQPAELQMTGLPPALQGYAKDLTWIDPDRGTEVNLWVPRIIFQ